MSDSLTGSKSKRHLNNNSKTRRSSYSFLQMCQKATRCLYRTTLGGILKYWLQTEPGFQDPLAMHSIVRSSSNDVSQHCNQRAILLPQHKKKKKKELAFPYKISLVLSSKKSLYFYWSQIKLKLNIANLILSKW